MRIGQFRQTCGVPDGIFFMRDDNHIDVKHPLYDHTAIDVRHRNNIKRGFAQLIDRIRVENIGHLDFNAWPTLANLSDRTRHDDGSCNREHTDAHTPAVRPCQLGHFVLHGVTVGHDCTGALLNMGRHRGKQVWRTESGILKTGFGSKQVCEMTLPDMRKRMARFQE